MIFGFESKQEIHQHKTDNIKKPTEPTDVLSVEYLPREQEIETIRNELHYLDPYSKNPEVINRKDELYNRLRELGVTVV